MLSKAWRFGVWEDAKFVEQKTLKPFGYKLQVEY